MTKIDVTKTTGDLDCMQVWGGNGSVENHFARPGLDVWIWSNSETHNFTGSSDLHLLSSCASGRITRAMLADICGSGPVLLEVGEGLRDLLKRNVNAIHQSGLVRGITRRLREYSEKGGFASVFVSTYFSPTKSLIVCNAGHPPPLLFRAEQNNWSPLKRVPNAGSERRELPPEILLEEEFQEFTTNLKEGDMLLSYSNSLTEFQDSTGRTLGVVGLLERVKTMSELPPREFIQGLTSTIRDEHPDNFTAADATLLLFRASSTPVGLKNNLLAPLRLLRPVSDNTRLE